MAARILIAGGYGLVGGSFARHLRRIAPDVELILAGRSAASGARLARELGNAAAVTLDIAQGLDQDVLTDVDLVVAALYDPANVLLEAALARGIAHLGITTLADGVAPAAFAALSARSPVALLGHGAAGVATIVARDAAAAFSRVQSVAVAMVYDTRDALGTMSAGDGDSLIRRALVREAGAWSWVDGTQRAREVRLPDGSAVQGYPTALLDAASLGAITRAPNVRVDLALGQSLGTRSGKRASHDIYVDVEGVLPSGAPAQRRTIISDPNGAGHLTALGMLVATERLLGLDGRTAAASGLHLPETLAIPEEAIARLRQFGVEVRHLEWDVP